MRQYNKYLIRITDQFDPENFSTVDAEVLTINERTENLPFLFKTEIIMSFLKDHSLQDEWTKANPELAELVTSGSLFTGSIKSLFESSRHNPVFLEHLELYLIKRFSE